MNKILTLLSQKQMENVDLDNFIYNNTPLSKDVFEIACLNSSLSFDISNNNFTINVLPRMGDKLIPIESFKSIWSLWYEQTISQLISHYCYEKNLKMINRDFQIKNNYLTSNKVLQSRFFYKNNIPFIRTSNQYQDNEMVIKSSYGSCGIGIRRVSVDMVSEIEHGKLVSQKTLIQEYIPYDNDYRVIVLNGKSIGIIERVPRKGDFRANISLGAKAFSVDEKDAKEVVELAEYTAKKLECDYAGIDILRHGSKLYVVEANFSPHYEGFETIYGTGYVVNKIKEYLLDI